MRGLGKGACVVEGSHQVVRLTGCIDLCSLCLSRACTTVSAVEKNMSKIQEDTSLRSYTLSDFPDDSIVPSPSFTSVFRPLERQQPSSARADDEEARCGPKGQGRFDREECACCQRSDDARPVQSKPTSESACRGE